MSPALSLVAASEAVGRLRDRLDRKLGMHARWHILLGHVAPWELALEAWAAELEERQLVADAIRAGAW